MIHPAAKAAFDRQAYLQARKRGSFTVYAPNDEQLREAQERARIAGYANFNAWLLHLVQITQAGSIFPPQYVQGLEKSVEQLRAWLEQKDQQLVDYARENRTRMRQREDLCVLLASTGHEEAAAQAPREGPS